jgi:hypothetical protein
LEGVQTPEEAVLPQRLHPSSELASLFVEPMRRGMEPRVCSCCPLPFALGDLRLGYAVRGRASPWELQRPYHCKWVHAVGCAGHLAIRIELGVTHVSFSPCVDEEARIRVLDCLVGLSRPRSRHDSRPLQSLCQWDYGPARLQRWRTFPVQATSRPASLIETWQALEIRQSLMAVLNDARQAAERVVEEFHAERALAETPSPMLLSLISMIPVEKLHHKAQEVCAICQEPMRLGEQCRRLPCFHLYHVQCIDPWLKLKGSCPIDKLMLKDMIQQQSVHAMQDIPRFVASHPTTGRSRSRSNRRVS